MPQNTETNGTAGDGVGRTASLVDCDIHQRWKSPEEIIQYLPPRHRERGVTAPEMLYHNTAGFGREDAIPSDGSDAGSDVALMREQHLEEFDVDYAVLTGNSYLNLPAIPNRDYAAELALAVNRWLIDTWLEEGAPFVGSILVAPQSPERSAEIIREVGTHPQVVQVLIPGGSAQLPYGNPYYWPIYEAAEELGLPIAIHPSTEGHGTSQPPTGAGHPNTYFEWHTLLGTYYMGQLASLLTEGVFAEYPDLKFVFIEGGLGWVPHFMWRMDKNWKGLRAQTPWLERRPSEYIRENVRFTTQPIEEPDDPRHLLQIFEMMHAEETVMFSSDYPHWDGDSPAYGLPPMPDDLRHRILHENARELYGLPEDPAELFTA